MVSPHCFPRFYNKCLFSSHPYDEQDHESMKWMNTESICLLLLVVYRDGTVNTSVPKHAHVHEEKLAQILQKLFLINLG